MAIPRGRFFWNFNDRGNEKAIRNIVKTWNGHVYYGDDEGAARYMCYNGNSGLHLFFGFTLPQVVPTSGHLWISSSMNPKVGVTLGQNDFEPRYDRYTANWYLYIDQENTPVNSSYNFYSSYYYYWGDGTKRFYYQSFGPNTYTVNAVPSSGRSGDHIPSLSLLVTKGTHISTGLASVLAIIPSSFERNWSEFNFWLWNPEIKGWITGYIKGIKQSLVDSSHIIISPVEFNGYSFPEIMLADGTSNPAFSAYCGVEQLKEYRYGIKKASLSNTLYYIPLTNSTQTIILIKKSPDDITISH